MYAVILGRMPFSTAMKDEYHRQKLLQAIQRGLSSHHDLEMQACSTDCRNLLRQLIEPKPELRLPLHEIQRHPWVTRNGRTVFYTYRPPPKNMHMRQQTIAELSIMMGLKRKEVAETVKESKADELSAMFNMILDRKRRDQGALDFDHTRRPFGNKGRSRSGSRERAVPAVRPSRLRGLTKSSKALSRSRAGSGERGKDL
ncbi:DgyrCDS1136 [Dimorphilus gyrociliatus]|uniref:DgyrCDS1136 n=1 Tax=Dimorphilus gyrociliatus TaxID=2664684 RepID=A0A7I8V866_9ANNE|nr:DgyrCDS1136 [Dimorphilus gyrociliatus]